MEFIEILVRNSKADRNEYRGTLYCHPALQPGEEQCPCTGGLPSRKFWLSASGEMCAEDWETSTRRQEPVKGEELASVTLFLAVSFASWMKTSPIFQQSTESTEKLVNFTFSWTEQGRNQR